MIFFNFHSLRHLLKIFSIFTFLKKKKNGWVWWDSPHQQLRRKKINLKKKLTVMTSLPASFTAKLIINIISNSITSSLQQTALPTADIGSKKFH
jgi:hypothetical protein